MAPRPKLPRHWVQKYSKAQQKHYFYNLVTKAKQWTPPALDQPIVENAADPVTVPSPAIRTRSKGLQLSHEDMSTVHSDETKTLQHVNTEGIEMPSTSSAEYPAVLLSKEKSTIKSCATEVVEIDEGLKLKKRKHSKDVCKPSKGIKKEKGMLNVNEQGMEEDEEMENSQENQLIFEEMQVVRKTMKSHECQVFRLHPVKTSIQETAGKITTAHQSASHKLWLVLDTNVLLKDMRLLKDLKLQFTEQFEDQFAFFFPWIVLQELDYIKDVHAPKSAELKNRAKDAVRVIGTWFDGKDPHVFGQDPRDAASLFDVKDGFVIQNNDDKVIHSCLQLVDKYTSNHVAIFTFDTNLRTKCRCAKFMSFNEKKLDDWLKAVQPTATPALAHRCFGNHDKTELKVVSVPVPLAVQAATSLAPQECNFFAGTSSGVPATFDSEESTKSTERVEGPSSSASRTTSHVEILNDEDQLRCFEFFDRVLANLREIKDRIREELLMCSVFGTSRPMVLRSFLQLHQHLSRILNHFERLMSERLSVSISPVYLDLLGAVFAFRDDFNLRLPSVDCKEVRLFCEDETKREMLAHGLLQFKEILSAVVDSQRLLTPAEKWCLFEKAD